MKQVPCCFHGLNMIRHKSARNKSPHSQEGLAAHGAPPLRARTAANVTDGAQNLHGQDGRDQQLGTRLEVAKHRVEDVLAICKLVARKTDYYGYPP